MLDRGLKLIVGNWQIALAILVVLIGTHSLAYCQGRTDGRAALLADQAEARAKAELVEDESEGEAAGERETDRGIITEAQEDRNDAVTTNATPGERPSATRIALQCERLRAAGTDIDQLPACRGREGRTETRP